MASYKTLSIIGALCMSAMAAHSQEFETNRLACFGVVKLKLQESLFEIDVEIAATGADRAQGLMWREEMERRTGMLFLFEEAQSRAFWMKNTLIPLDIGFYDEQGKLVTLHQNAIPHDETPLGSAPAIAVLELNAGEFSGLEEHSLSFHLDPSANCASFVEMHPMMVR